MMKLLFPYYRFWANIIGKKKTNMLTGIFDRKIYLFCHKLSGDLNKKHSKFNYNIKLYKSTWHLTVVIFYR